MVVVLKAGKPYSADVECTGRGNGDGGCGALLRVGRSDLRFFAEQERMFNIVPKAVVMKCPLCGVTTDLKKEDWPPRAKELTKWTGAWRSAPVTADG